MSRDGFGVKKNKNEYGKYSQTMALMLCILLEFISVNLMCTSICLLTELRRFVSRSV